MKKLAKTLTLVAMLSLLLGSNALAITEDVNGDVSPDEAPVEIPADASKRDKEIRDYHTAEEAYKTQKYLGAEEEVNGDVSPDEGPVEIPDSAYKQDKMIYEPSGYVGYNVQLDVPIYLQKNGDFGGPATVEMIIDYLMDPRYNQETYAKEMYTDANGTNIEDLVDSLNFHQDVYGYDKVSIDSEYHLVDCLMKALDKGMPVVADISTSNAYLKGLYPYSMPGHYLVVSGLEVNEDEETILTLIDPYKIGKTKISLDVFYDMVTDHWDRAIIY